AEKKKNRQITQPSSSSPATSSPRKSTGSSASSPEFEFWMVRNPSEPQPNILSADQLFVNGVLLPLHLLPQNPLPDSDPDSDPKPDIVKHHPDPSPPESSAVASSASKRWKDIFKIGDRKASSSNEVLEEKEKEKRKKEKKSSFSSSSISSSAADLNINIWPFSRSRSAGNGSSSGRARAAAAARKASSAPCSRSNSAGESKSSKKWPSSPGRAGVHLGRSSPVWQVRRPGKAAEPAAVRREGAGARRAGGGGGDRTNSSGSTARVLNLSVPLCIGYRQHLSCSRDESGIGNPSREDGNAAVAAAPGNSNSPLFNLRTLFSKKVH
ncbi:hypothetical protein ACLOJK_004024, partial [Asimina triloba]